MAAQVIQIADGAQFNTELNNAESKLVVVDFFATWCGPCQRIAPFFATLATKYPRAVFLKVDVDKCQETASSHGVTAMPTFLFFRNKVKLDSVKGADPNVLEEAIKKWYEAEEGEEVAVKGHMDLLSLINKSGCECLNESDDHPLDHALTSKGGFLESDCDEQLIIHFAFTQTVKLHSIKLNGPPEKGPKEIKLFINQPNTLDFDGAERMDGVQQMELNAEDILSGALIPLRFVKYQSVQNLTIFVKNNQAGEDTTQIDNIGIIGSPVTVTNMNEFKRVAGKKGESE